jgi:hypothetical protein
VGTGVSNEDRVHGSGGVQQGGLQEDGSSVAGPAAPAYRDAYRSARARMDTAVARDEVPRARRAYVRDYFLAIAPRD